MWSWYHQWYNVFVCFITFLSIFPGCKRFSTISEGYCTFSCLIQFVIVYIFCHVLSTLLRAVLNCFLFNNPLNWTELTSQVVHSEGSDEWTLVVRYTQARDAGIYDCQVNTDPKLSRPVTLNVLGKSSLKSWVSYCWCVSNHSLDALTHPINFTVIVQWTRRCVQ